MGFVIFVAILAGVLSLVGVGLALATLARRLRALTRAWHRLAAQGQRAQAQQVQLGQLRRRAAELVELVSTGRRVEM